MLSAEIETFLEKLKKIDHIEVVDESQERRLIYIYYSGNSQYTLGYIDKNTRKNGGVFNYHFNRHQWTTQKPGGANNANFSEYSYEEDSERLKRDFCEIYQCQPDCIDIVPGTRSDTKKCYVLVKTVESAIAIIKTQIRNLPKK